MRTLERILKAAGFAKLPRRTNSALGQGGSTQKRIPERAAMLGFSAPGPFAVETPCVGVFFRMPDLLESNMPDVVSCPHLLTLTRSALAFPGYFSSLQGGIA